MTDAHGSRVAFSFVLATVFTGCAAAAGDHELSDVGLAQSAIQNGDLVDASGAVVEIRVPFSGGAVNTCSATIINENSLITAAHCGDQPNSYWPNISVLYQEDSTTWRCLTGVDAMGNTIRGTHATVVRSCPQVNVGWGSMYDEGTDWRKFAGTMPGEMWEAPKHDFAVVKVWTAGFVWRELEDTANYAALFADNIVDGNEWAYGIGHTSTTTIDHRVRREEFDIVYHDDYNLGGFGTNGQLCSGDSGGPVGVFLPESDRFAVVGVANVIPLHTVRMNPNDPICGTNGGPTYWANAVPRISYIEKAIGKTCRSVVAGGIQTKECWD